ncbi:MAG: PD-(D/E)XK nuclease family protein [Anaerohalosphaeraceae bacterium]|nr:PD-(D/E)XK nuclease family protein [Chloroflexota bacterium]
MLDHLSYSSISSYLMCAANWKMHYIDKISGPTSTALIFGSAFHGAIEGYLIGQVKSEQPKSLIEHWQESWKRETTLEGQPRTDIDWMMDTPESMCNEGVRLLSNLDIQRGILSIKPLIGENGKPAIEAKIELHVPGVPIPIIGYIDVITADGVPGDFKTSSKSWSDDKAGDEIQTLFYLAALNQAGIKVPDWAFTHYVFVKTKTPQFQKFTHKHNPAQLMWLFKMIQNVWKGIEAGIFPENPGTWKCNPRYCEYWNLCRGKNG